MQDGAYRGGDHRAAVLARIRLVADAQMVASNRLALATKNPAGPTTLPQKLKALGGCPKVLNKVSQRVTVHRSIFK